MEVTCINCPVGCRMEVALEAGAVRSVSGNACRRGERYARRECTAPERMVSAVVPVAGCRMPLSVKTRTPIPKASVPACMQALSLLRPVPPILAGETVLADVCGTGVDIVATRTVRVGD